MAITASTLVDFQVELDAARFDARYQAQFMPHIETLRAVKAEQTAIVEPVTNPGRFAKKRTVDVWWANFCNIVATDTCTTNCTLTGVAVDTDAMEMDVDKCFEATFTIPETALHTNAAEMPKLVAQATLRAEKVILEKYTRAIIASIDAAKECATLTGLPTGWACTAGNVVVPFADMQNLNSLNLMSYIATMNDFSDPYILSGFNFWNAYLTAVQNSGNGEGSGEAARSALIRSYFDPRNIDVLNAPDLKTYMLNRGTVATFEGNFVGPDLVEYQFGQQRYMQESRLFPGIFFDVFHTDSCVAGNVGLTWKFQLNAGIWINPAGCGTTNNGVVSFLTDGAPAI